MTPQSLPPGLQQEFDSFQQEILAKLQQEIKTLGTTIFRTVNSQASGPRSQTRSGKLPGRNDLSNVISLHLNEFAEHFVRSINIEFNRRFSSLSVSTERGPIQADTTVGGRARAWTDAPPRDEHPIDQGTTERLPNLATLGLLLQLGEKNADIVTNNYSTGSKSTSVDIGAATSPLSELSVADEALSVGGRQMHSLDVEQLGESLVPSVAKVIADDMFKGMVHIKNLEDMHWADLQTVIQPPKNHDLLGVEYVSGQAGKGFSLLTTSMRTEFKFPNFEAVNGPSKPDIDKYLQQLTNDPPKRPIPYYVGPLLTPHFDLFLHPGNELSKLDHIPGINTPYWHAGEQGLGTAFHCEDARFRSCNLTLSG
ncbi:Uu.00g107700.m01.CDS01 [Anthostomella pinea]|uniref:Uu.00g107700.m01.CDS01 n=1 Tax=Anthostomella pinea TaxID=933095 RepID=A0AAI8VED7_9PEZI|nr:Uu.00g107700.m01.CDS01 [Anthostomella pinea]